MPAGSDGTVATTGAVTRSLVDVDPVPADRDDPPLEHEAKAAAPTVSATSAPATADVRRPPTRMERRYRTTFPPEPAGSRLAACEGLRVSNLPSRPAGPPSFRPTLRLRDRVLD